MARREHGNEVIWAFIGFIKKKPGRLLKESVTSKLNEAIPSPC